MVKGKGSTRPRRRTTKDLSPAARLDALLLNGQRMRSIVTAAVDAIITITPSGIIDSVNPAARRLFGYKERELVGRNVKILMPEPYHGEHDGYLRDYLRTGIAKIIGIGREVTAIRRDGTTFPISLSVSEVKNEGDRVFAGIIHDLTDRRLLERQIVETSANEQRRIGQDLHDGLCQDLIGIAFAADHIARTLRAKGICLEADSADHLAASVRAAAGQARQLSHGLNPVDLKAGGLRTALLALCEKISDSFRVNCSFKCPREPQITDDTTATHLYRIAQEAVSNAIRHGHARQIGVEIDVTTDKLVLIVWDDGVGLPQFKTSDAAKAPHFDTGGGIGLQTMRYRAHIINGVFEIRPHPLGGAMVICSVRGNFLTRKANAGAKNPSRSRKRPENERRGNSRKLID